MKFYWLLEIENDHLPADALVAADIFQFTKALKAKFPENFEFYTPTDLGEFGKKLTAHAKKQESPW